MIKLPSPEVIFTGLATTLWDLPIDVYQFWRDAVNPPCLLSYMVNMPRDGIQPAEFVSVILVGMTDEASAQQQCYDLATRAAELVDADHTLAGAVSSAWCRAFRNSRPWPMQDGRQRMWSLELVWDVLLDP